MRINFLPPPAKVNRQQTGPGMEPKTGIFHRTRTMSSKIPEIPVPEN
jgi:hypothetical protein